MGYDVVLRDGRIVDWTGSPWRRGDLTVDAGRIAAVGSVGADVDAAEEIPPRAP